MKKLNNKGQAQVLEAVLVAGLLLTSLFFVRSLEISSHSSVESDDRFETYAIGAFESLEGQPDPTGETSSFFARLVKYYLDGYSYRYYDTIIKRIDDALPEGTLYQILLINISKLYSNGSSTVDNCTSVIYEHPVWIDEGIRASRYVAVNGYLYSIVICMWLNLRR